MHTTLSNEKSKGEVKTTCHSKENVKDVRNYSNQQEDVIGSVLIVLELNGWKSI